MKTLASILALSALLSVPAFAKSGDDSVKVPARGTRAWFALEAGEHSLRNLALTDSNAADAVTGIATTLDGDIATVVIGFDNVSVEYSCIQFDDFSKSGTVVKKDVACQRL